MKSNSCFITVDVGSSRVVGAVIQTKEGNKPEILYTSYKEVAFQSSLDIARYTTLVIASLDACLRDLSNHAGGLRTVQVLCTISSLLYEPTITIHEKTFPNDTKITSDILNEISESQHDKPVQGITKAEHTIMQVKLNGYPTSHPLGRYAHIAEMAVYTSKADAMLLSKIKSSIAGFFHSASVAVHPFSFAAFTVIRDIVQDQNFVCLDFGGEITDVVVSKNGIIEKTISIPFGKNSILRELMESSNISVEVAESSLALYNQGRLAPDAIPKIESGIDKARDHWTTLFLGTLEHITLNLLLPPDLYLLAHSSVAPIVSKFITREQYSRYVFVGQPFVLHQVTDATLAPLCVTRGLSTAPDPFVMISSLFSAKLETSKK